MPPSNEHRLRELLHLPPVSGAGCAGAARNEVLPEAPPREYWDEIFLRLGRGHGIEPQAPGYPVDHSLLMDELAPLVAPWLGRARFSQSLPGQADAAWLGGVSLFSSEEEEGRGTGHRYTLRLTHAGRRHAVTFHDSSEYYNLNALLALMNAALEDCDTALRLFGLGSVVLLGPLEGLQQALREGFIPGYEGEGIHEDWELEAIDAWSESGDTPESLARQLHKGQRQVRVSLVV